MPAAGHLAAFLQDLDRLRIRSAVRYARQSDKVDGRAHLLEAEFGDALTQLDDGLELPLAAAQLVGYVHRLVRGLVAVRHELHGLAHLPCVGFKIIGPDVVEGRRILDD